MSITVFQRLLRLAWFKYSFVCIFPCDHSPIRKLRSNEISENLKSWGQALTITRPTRINACSQARPCLLEHPLSRLPNICPYRQIQSCVNVYKFSFYPRTIVTWNHIPFNNLCQSTLSFKTRAMPSIKLLNVAN